MKLLTVLARALLTGSVLTAVALAPATGALASTPGQLDSGATLGPGATLYSPSGNMALTMQTDGNLVLYAPGHVAVWATGTSSAGNGTILAEQSDGNLVVIAPGNHPVWASGTSGHPGAVLQVQDDGNTVQYGSGHAALWSTNTSTGTSSVASLAVANQGATACGRNSLGGTGFYTSCKPENWCADFAMWVWAHSGYNVSGLSPAAYSFYKYGKDRGTLHAHPAVGDAVVYDVSGTYASHVGIVTGISNGLIHTENGNWGGSSTTTSSVKPQDMPDSTTIGTRTSFGKTVSGFVSPVR
ncbi:CHAP domain-containing protein [Actinoplanes sp. N902-109]|uniref:CHAP domain-containing protein n=1 Tax=Actinoplanes sp. (strain N902-109) TaxID=649831 RepID=UPI00032966D9|nr:CHAP domain-containing protein [Actinoplanes sp. N902-109]AGL13707.1 hypothetical protein L083_0197 [Actinoplanes sp. N902-109]